MKKILKKYDVYFILPTIIACLLAVVYFVKDIFPFGNYSIIWSDLHEQITSFYYHFYDSIKGGESLFIDFKTALGINFFGTFGYYLSSVFSFLILLVPRNMIYLVISVLILLKFVFCGETALYAFKKFFPNVPKKYLLLLSLFYAFSGYTLSFYMITGWIDVVALFPLLCVGLKELLDKHSCNMYLIVLTISIISNFYLAFMTLIFVFFASLLYTFFFTESQKRKKVLSLLAIYTLISIFLSAFLLFPTIYQILNSARTGFSISTILNSGLGPITDKVSLFFLSGFSFATLILLLKTKNKDKKIVTFIIILLVFLMLPVLCEGINKLWHFGSYSFFPLRYSFMTIFILLLSSGYYLSLDDSDKKECSKLTKIGLMVFTVFVGIIIILASVIFYQDIQAAIDSLTLSSDKKVALILLAMFILVTMVLILAMMKLKRKNKLLFLITSFILLVHLMVNLFFYLGIDYDKERLNKDYQTMQLLSADYNNDIYRLKNIDYMLFSNYGNVSSYQTLSHFTSLITDSTLRISQKMGYSSIWTKMLSSSGTLFSDALFGNKFIISENEIDIPYYSFVKKYNNRNFYKNDLDISFGYLIDDNYSLKEFNNPFQLSNYIYKSITGEDDLFVIYNDFQKEGNVLNKKIYVENEQCLYLDIRKYDNIYNSKLNNAIKVLVNGKEVRNAYPTKKENGILYLGEFANEIVNVTITLLNEKEFDSLTIGTMNLDLFERFIEENKINADIQFKKNNILINLDSEEEKLLFLPVAYDQGYVGYNNGVITEVNKVFDGFIGVRLNKGKNNIVLTFFPKGLKLGAITTLITLIIMFLIIKFKNQILNLKIFNSFIYYVYLIIAAIAFLIMYILPVIGMIL